MSDRREKEEALQYSLVFRITISRAKGSLTFSANFQLIAAMNPCPCGYYGDSQKPCSCAPSTVTKYQKRISGPLLDRIDIHIEVPCVDYEKLSGDRLSESNASIRARVQTARDCSPIFLSTLYIVVYRWVVCR